MKTNANMSESELRSPEIDRANARYCRKQLAYERYTRRYQRIGRITNHTSRTT